MRAKGPFNRIAPVQITMYEATPLHRDENSEIRKIRKKGKMGGFKADVLGMFGIKR